MSTWYGIFVRCRPKWYFPNLNRVLLDALPVFGRLLPETISGLGDCSIQKDTCKQSYLKYTYVITVWPEANFADELVVTATFFVATWFKFNVSMFCFVIGRTRGIRCREESEITRSSGEGLGSASSGNRCPPDSVCALYVFSGVSKDPTEDKGRFVAKSHRDKY